jgi:hypothetical protein
MSDSSDKPLIPPYRCRDCASEVGFRSRRRTWTERFLLPLLLLKPVRCGECFRRDYRWVFTEVRDRLPEIPREAPRMMPGKPPATSKRNVA